MQFSAVHVLSMLSLLLSHGLADLPASKHTRVDPGGPVGSFQIKPSHPRFNLKTRETREIADGGLL